ncbi:MAG: hypothetical protein HY518_03745 [Candidatus Aenigmarchaeota archaeon]|nr:hypothetical protein [Candidatus Aenigmarchaeota archaeon]
MSRRRWLPWVVGGAVLAGIGYGLYSCGLPSVQFGKEEKKVYSPAQTPLVVNHVGTALLRNRYTLEADGKNNMVTFAVDRINGLEIGVLPEEVFEWGSDPNNPCVELYDPKNLTAMRIKDKCKTTWKMVVPYQSQRQAQAIEDNLDPNKTENPIGIVYLSAFDTGDVVDYGSPFMGLGSTGTPYSIIPEENLIIVRNPDFLWFYDANSHKVSPQDLPIVKKGEDFTLGNRKAHDVPKRKVPYQPDGFHTQPAAPGSPISGIPGTGVDPAAFGRLESDFLSLAGDVGRIDGQLEDVNAHIAAQRRELGDMRENYGRLDGKTDIIGRRIDELGNGDYGALAERVTGLADDMDVLKGTVDYRFRTETNNMSFDRAKGRFQAKKGQ